MREAVLTAERALESSQRWTVSNLEVLGPAVCFLFSSTKTLAGLSFELISFVDSIFVGFLKQNQVCFNSIECFQGGWPRHWCEFEPTNPLLSQSSKENLGVFFFFNVLQWWSHTLSIFIGPARHVSLIFVPCVRHKWVGRKEHKDKTIRPSKALWKWTDESKSMGSSTHWRLVQSWLVFGVLLDPQPLWPFDWPEEFIVKLK